DPIAVRLTVAPRVKLEMCVLPLARNSIYNELRGWTGGTAQTPDLGVVPKSAVASIVAMRGTKALGEFVSSLPGVKDALQADPTPTDLTWLGNQMAVHFCASDKILEMDPLRLQELNVMGFKVSAAQQAMLAIALTSTIVPTCYPLEVEDRDKAARLLEVLT